MIYFYFLFFLIGAISYWYDMDFNVNYFSSREETNKKILLSMVFTFVVYQFWIIYFIVRELTKNRG